MVAVRIESGSSQRRRGARPPSAAHGRTRLGVMLVLSVAVAAVAPAGAAGAATKGQVGAESASRGARGLQQRWLRRPGRRRARRVGGCGGVRRCGERCLRLGAGAVGDSRAGPDLDAEQPRRGGRRRGRRQVRGRGSRSVTSTVTGSTTWRSSAVGGLASRRTRGRST